jgi:hypothetical protein
VLRRVLAGAGVAGRRGKRSRAPLPCALPVLRLVVAPSHSSSCSRGMQTRGAQAACSRCVAASKSPFVTASRPHVCVRACVRACACVRAGDGPALLQQEPTPRGAGAAAVGARGAGGGVGVLSKLSWGVPNSFGFETAPRSPVRSADSLGNALPGVAEELQPPGFWKQVTNSLTLPRPATLQTLRPTPYTPTPHTLHPTPYTLHPTPYTLHPKHYTYTLTPTPRAGRKPAPYTLHPTPYSLNPSTKP